MFNFLKGMKAIKMDQTRVFRAQNTLLEHINKESRSQSAEIAAKNLINTDRIEKLMYSRFQNS